MEKFMNLLGSEILSKCQHGFLPGRSTVSNLCTFAENALNALNQRKQLDVVYTDCAKAFDRVDHCLLLEKLGCLGFSKNAVAFVQSYLGGRRNVVKVGGARSEVFEATSGVPHDSNLGPLLFLMFINDLPYGVRSSTCLLYADDFKIFRTVNDKTDCSKLQADLNDAVVEWFNMNHMSLNIEKCSGVTFTRKLELRKASYYVGAALLNRKTEVVDLGVTFHQSLKFNNHYHNITSKAYKALGFVLRNSRHFQISTIIALYNACVSFNYMDANCISKY